MIATKKVMSWMLVATVFAGTAAACGSDAKKTTTTAAAGGDTAGGGASANPEVTAFCVSVEDLTAKLKEVMADPTKAADLAALTASAAELSTKAAALISASPADAAAVNVCVTKMSTALTGG